MKPIVWAGDLNSPSGYSKAIRNNMRALIEAGVDVIGQQHKYDRSDAPLDSFWQKHMPKILRPGKIPNGRLIRVHQETAEMYNPDPSYYEIGFLVWETDRIPDFDMDGNPRRNWVKQMNRMDEIWTACAHNARIFKRCGINVPIHVFPHPIDLELFSPGPRFPLIDSRTKDVANDKRFTLLSLFQWSKRKNPEALLASYMAEFHDRADTLLVLKTYGTHFEDKDGVRDMIRRIKEVARPMGSNKNIMVLMDLVPDTDLPMLYNACDVFILPTMGEGFGIPFQEAMACGKPVIFTNATAMPDYIDDTCGWPLGYTKEPVLGQPWWCYNIHQNWYRPSISELRKSMREAYNAWKSGELEHLGQNARERITSLHTYEIVGKAFRDRVEAIYADQD